MAINYPCSVGSTDEASEMIELLEVMALPISVSNEYPDPYSTFSMDPYGYIRKPDGESSSEGSLVEASESESDNTTVNNLEYTEEDKISETSIEPTDNFVEEDSMSGMDYSYDDAPNDLSEETEDTDRYGYTNLVELI